MTEEDARAFASCLLAGGVVVFPTDTVYGLGCDPGNATAVRRLYTLKGRAPDKPAAVMLFLASLALAALPELGPRTRMAVRALLPGAVTLLVPNPAHRFPAACGPDPGTLGLRVPELPGALSALSSVGQPVLQSSANLAGGPDARRLNAVPAILREQADLVLDGGELPGVASTVMDLRVYESDGTWSIVRAGAVSSEEIVSRLRSAASR